MANTYDIIKDGKIITVSNLIVAYLANFNNESYSVVLTPNDTTFSITAEDYNGIKNLDYSSGGGSGSGSTVAFDDQTQILTIDGVQHQISGGSEMVFNTNTHILSGAVDQNGNSVSFELGNVTITI